MHFLTTSLEMTPQANEPQHPKPMSPDTEASQHPEPVLGKRYHLSKPRALEYFAMSTVVFLGQVKQHHF